MFERPSRRSWIQAAGGALALISGRPSVAAADSKPANSVARSDIAACWRGPRASDPHFAGVISVDWESSRASIRSRVLLPGRAHGLVAEPDGSLLVVAVRPGRWIVRIDPSGRLQDTRRLDDEAPAGSLNGHAWSNTHRKIVVTTETRDEDGSGMVVVRDHGSLAPVARWSTHGIEPHHLLGVDDRTVMVAHGGLRRDERDRKLNRDAMQSNLTCINIDTGELVGQWRVDDPHLSLRHLAWVPRSAPSTRFGDQDAPQADGRTALAIAMQAEHPEPNLRERAPVVALWSEAGLHTLRGDSGMLGYAGDIAAAGSGVAVSSHLGGRVVLHQPNAPSSAMDIARLRNAYALASDQHGALLIAAAAGIARWHPNETPAMVPWPEPMALDNHWVALGAGRL